MGPVSGLPSAPRSSPFGPVSGLPSAPKSSPLGPTSGLPSAPSNSPFGPSNGFSLGVYVLKIMFIKKLSRSSLYGVVLFSNLLSNMSAP